MDPDLKRERTRLYNVSLDHELRPGLGVSVAYNRRRSYDIGVLDNLATTFDDYTRFTIPDPRGNGQTIEGYYLNRNKLGIVDQIDTTSNSNTRYYNGVRSQRARTSAQWRPVLRRVVDRASDRDDV